MLRPRRRSRYLNVSEKAHCRTAQKSDPNWDSLAGIRMFRIFQEKEERKKKKLRNKVSKQEEVFGDKPSSSGAPDGLVIIIDQQFASMGKKMGKLNQR